MSRQALLLSNTKVFGQERFAFAKDCITEFLRKNDIERILFVPYALKDHDDYTITMREAFKPYGVTLEGIHTMESPKKAVENAKAIYVGGGNTFVLLKTLHEKGLVEIIRERVLSGQLAYMGASAGTNVATPSIHTTNDMPIVHPPTLDAIDIVPFNINPHYVNTDPSSTHMGETRDTRIQEFLQMGYGRKVVGLYEGALLVVDGDKLTLQGAKGGKLFDEKCPDVPVDLSVGQDLSHLL